MSAKSYTFTHAICRKPSFSIVDGLRAVDTGIPDLSQFARDHQTYIETLRQTWAEVIILDPLEAFPDAVFVEDTALCLPEGAVLLRPGAPTRLGEVEEMAGALERLYGQVRRIDGDAFIEGGDILTTETEILVGLSERTNRAGAEALRRHVEAWGYTVRVVDTPPGVLHFKTDCALLDEETILSTRRLDASGCFSGYRVIHAADGEDAAANAIRFNNLVLLPAGFPATRDRLVQAGYEVREIGNDEAAKVDGGLSCLSLRFSPR